MTTHSVEIQDFCITQILREINFGEARSAKNAGFAILGGVNLVNVMKKCKNS